MEWLGKKVKHRFLHKESGKVYEWTPDNILSRGFPKDLRTNEDHFSELKQYADVHGVELLETRWLGSHVDHRFTCDGGTTVQKCTPNQMYRQGVPKRLLKPDGNPIPRLPVPIPQSKLTAAKARAAELAAITLPYPGDDALMEIPSKKVEPIAVAVDDDQEEEIVRERVIG